MVFGEEFDTASGSGAFDSGSPTEIVWPRPLTESKGRIISPIGERAPEAWIPEAMVEYVVNISPTCDDFPLQ